MVIAQAPVRMFVGEKTNIHIHIDTRVHFNVQT